MEYTQPTLNEIIEYRYILEKNNIQILNDLLHNTPDPDDNKLIIFNKPIGNDEEPELDEKNVLDMNGELTDVLINKLIEDHKREHTDDGWEDSISRFEKLKTVIEQYNNEVLELKLLPVTKEEIPPFFPKYTGEEYRLAKKHYADVKKFRSANKLFKNQPNSLGGKSKKKKKSGKKSKRKKGKKSGKTRKI